MAKVLIVDDDANFRETVQTILAEEGYETAVAENGNEAVQTFNNTKPNLVILDMLMPKMGGFDCAAKLRSTPLGEGVPIIFISGIYKSPQISTEAVERFKCAAFMVKPFGSQDLIAAVKNALGESALSTASAVAPTTPMPEAGLLLEYPVVHLLLRVAEERHSGILELFSEAERARLFFFRGTVVQAQSSKPDRNLCISLLKMGHIRPAESKTIIEYVEQNAVGLHQAITDLKLTDDATIKEAYRLVIPEIVSGIVALVGQFKWINGDAFMRYIPTTSLPIASALYHGIRNASFEQLRAHVEPRASFRMSKGTRWQMGKTHLEQGLGDSDVLSTVNGRTRIGQVYASVNDKEKQRSRMAQIYVLMGSGAVTLTQEVVEVEPSVVAPQPVQLGEHGVDFDEDKVRAAFQTAEAGPPDHMAEAFFEDVSADAKIDAQFQFTEEEQASRQRIFDKFKEIRDLTYYQVFGIEAENFNADVVKKAYFQLAKEFHTDSYAGQNLGSAQSKLEAVFAKISEAYSVLTTESKRSEYDAQLSLSGNGITADVAAIFNAESLFDKAKIMADRGDYVAASRYLEEAMGLYPQPAIEVWWLYCGFRARNNQAEKAQTVSRIEQLLQDAHVERGLEFLAIICRLSNDLVKAKKYINKAINDNGRTPALEREIRALQKLSAPEAKKSGLAKLFGGG